MLGSGSGSVGDSILEDGEGVWEAWDVRDGKGGRHPETERSGAPPFLCGGRRWRCFHCRSACLGTMQLMQLMQLMRLKRAPSRKTHSARSRFPACFGWVRVRWSLWLTGAYTFVMDVFTHVFAGQLPGLELNRRGMPAWLRTRRTVYALNLWRRVGVRTGYACLKSEGDVSAFCVAVTFDDDPERHPEVQLWHRGA